MTLNRGAAFVGESDGDSLTFGVRIDCFSVFRTEYSISVLLWRTASSYTLRFYASGKVCAMSDSVG